MTVKKINPGEFVGEKDGFSKEIYIVIQGSVLFKTKQEEFLLEKGSVIGLLSQFMGDYPCEYVAQTDVVLAVYEFSNIDDLKNIFVEQPQYSYAFLHASICQCRNVQTRYMELSNLVNGIVNFAKKQYEEYEVMCAQSDVEPHGFASVEKLQQFVLSNNIESWELEYQQQLGMEDETNIKRFYFSKPKLCLGAILQIVNLMARMIMNLECLKEYLNSAKSLLISDEEDLLEMWFDLSVKYATKGENCLLVQVKVHELQDFIMGIDLYTKEEVDARFRSYWGIDFEHYIIVHADENEEKEEDDIKSISMSLEEILETDFTTHIMEYAECEAEDISKMKAYIAKYAALPDKLASGTEMNKLRKMITEAYYAVYEKAIFKAVKTKQLTPILELFFQFGVMDLELAGKDNIEGLLDILEQIQSIKDESVFTMYQWFQAIYQGVREPSKNEFDLDYNEYLLQQRKEHRITKEEEKELKLNQDKKLTYELHNMFRSTNRATYGRITTFCPLFNGDDLIRDIMQMWVSPTRIHETIDEIRRVDYSLFYREVFFADPDHGIPRTQIWKEVLPDVILTPNIGSRAMMWQENSGVTKNTPARFIFSIMTAENLEQMMLETCGRYRWEICKKIMGVRWNDIREKSLTSEYYDYVQFYRKNKDLSPQAKEKIKAQMVHAKNNNREVFVLDYVSWMKYEAQGNVRLNKVARKIFVDWIPFSQEVRQKLSDNPMFKEIFHKFEILRNRRFDKAYQLYNRYKNEGGEITPELQMHLDFYEK